MLIIEPTQYLQFHEQRAKIFEKNVRFCNYKKLNPNSLSNGQHAATSGDNIPKILVWFADKVV